jgi:probable rRNA maturation factor
MEMEINVFNNYNGEINFDYQKIIDAIRNYFKFEKTASLILVDNQEIHKINLQYRGIDRSTDVISFEDDEDDYIGEIFISIDKVIEQSRTYNHSVEREFAFLLIHGLLHLQGYDHQTSAEEKIMFEKQEEILTELNFRRDK